MMQLPELRLKQKGSWFKGGEHSKTVEWQYKKYKELDDAESQCMSSGKIFFQVENKFEQSFTINVTRCVAIRNFPHWQHRDNTYFDIIYTMLHTQTRTIFSFLVFFWGRGTPGASKG